MNTNFVIRIFYIVEVFLMVSLLAFWGQIIRLEPSLFISLSWKLLSLKPIFKLRLNRQRNLIFFLFWSIFWRESECILRNRERFCSLLWPKNLLKKWQIFWLRRDLRHFICIVKLQRLIAERLSRSWGVARLILSWG